MKTIHGIIEAHRRIIHRYNQWDNKKNLRYHYPFELKYTPSPRWATIRALASPPGPLGVHQRAASQMIYRLVDRAL